MHQSANRRPTLFAPKSGPIGQKFKQLRSNNNAKIPKCPFLKTNKMTIRLLLVKENFLQCSGIFHGSNKRIDKQDIERIFNSYDRVSARQGFLGGRLFVEPRGEVLWQKKIGPQTLQHNAHANTHTHAEPRGYSLAPSANDLLAPS